MSLVDNVAEIQRLRERIEELKEDILQLQEPAGPFFDLPLTRTETMIVGMLLRQQHVRTEGIYAALCIRASRDSDVPNPEVVRVHICHIRKKLAPHGIRINTKYWHGYYWMDGESKRLLAGLQIGKQ